MRLAWLLVFAAVGASCSRNPSAAPRGKGVILTTFQPLYSFASKVVEGSPCLEVVNLAPRNLGPHDFNLEEKHGALVRRAAAIVTLRALPVAPAFDRIYPWCRKVNIGIVEIDPSVTWEASTPKLPLLQDPADGVAAAGTGIDNPNPHVWLSLSHAVRLVERIAQDVSALDSDHAELYRANADRFQESLRALKAETEQRLASLDRLSIVSLTEGFPYLTSEFGLHVVDYILEPKDAAQITQRVKASGVKVVLAEEAPEPRVAQAVAAGGAKLVVLATLEEGWGKGESLDPDGYLKGMRDNLNKLVDALRDP